MNIQIKNIAILVATLMATRTVAQTTQWGESTNNQRFPTEEYNEMPNPLKPDPQQWSRVKGIKVSWADNNFRYNKEKVPAIRENLRKSVTGWRGENISSQALVWSASDVEDLNFSVDFPSDIDISASFVRYVLQDDMLKCGARKDITSYNASMSADVIDPYAKSLDIEAMSVRPIWLTLNIPKQTPAGIYNGVVTVKSGDKEIAELKLNVKVLDHILPEPTEWTFLLDFWQNPYAEARYAGLEPFSQQHLDQMRPQMERLRDAGQKVITTSINHKPWGAQVDDYYESMITWIYRIDGTWAFDYTIFDTWVEYMMEIGIKDYISCYSMIPWSMTFKYYDQRSNSMKELVTTTYDDEYHTMWVSALKSLAEHLREKGWFEKTTIAMDERAPKDMRNAFAIIKEADPDFKVSLAGANHPEIEEDLFFYSMATNNIFTPEVIQKRKAKCQLTAFYTCCAQDYPNLFTFSPPSEAEWIGWFAAAKGYDGYTRWAFNSYTLEPLMDSRFDKFPSGDCYTVYPMRSSIRHERFIDGVESFVSIRDNTYLNIST